MSSNMRSSAPEQVNGSIKDLANYAEKLYYILYQSALIKGRSGSNLKNFGNISATVTTLNQLSELLSKATPPQLDSSSGAFPYPECLGNIEELCDDPAQPVLVPGPVFNQECLQYVEALVKEASIALARIGTEVSQILHRKRNSPSWHSAFENGQPENLGLPILQELEIIRVLGGSNWTRILATLKPVKNRLGHLQLRLLLVVQLLTVREMITKSLTTGSAVQDIVDYYLCIREVANSAGLADSDGLVNKPRGQQKTRYSDSPLSSDVDSDSSASDSTCTKSPRARRRRGGPRWQPPPPPPPNWRRPPPPPRWALGPPPPTQWDDPQTPSYLVPSMSDAGCGIKITEAAPPQVQEVVCPPLYAEREDIVGTADNKQKVQESAESPSSASSINKLSGAQTGEEASTSARLNEPPTTSSTDGRLFKSKAGFSMKVKTLFRTKSSLAAEMVKTLSDNDSQLTAYVLQNREFNRVPHSAFHSLEWTHMRTILSQLHNNTWFKTFSDLTDREHIGLDDVSHFRYLDGKAIDRELVVLKVLQKNKFNAWMRLIESCIGTNDLIHHENYRIILAIFRDKPRVSKNEASASTPDPVPTAVTPHTSTEPALIDEPVPRFMMGPDISDITTSSHRGRRPKISLPPNPPQSFDGTGVASCCEDFPPSPKPKPTDASARIALTTYSAFTFRPKVTTSPRGMYMYSPEAPPTWSRCILTPGLESRTVLLQRIAAFQARGSSIVDLKLRLTEHQAAQLARLMEDLATWETDTNFIYHIVELSMTDRDMGRLGCHTADTVVDAIHVITQRTPREGVRCVELYKELMNDVDRSMLACRPPPPPPPPHIVILDDRPPRRRAVSETSDSDRASSSSAWSENTTASGYRRFKERRRRRQELTKDGNGGVSSDSDEESKSRGKRRWIVDPADIRFDRAEKGKDIVQILLDRWTMQAGKETGNSVDPATILLPDDGSEGWSSDSSSSSSTSFVDD